MTGTKLFAAVGIAGLLLGIAVGPGFSLFRCLLTGEVSLSCCCERALESGSPASPDTVAADCCAIQRVEPAGRGLPASGPALQPLLAALSPVTPGPELVFSGLNLARIVGRLEPPCPRWLSAGALLL